MDGFFEAFWRRPEALLDPAVRSAQSMWRLLDAVLDHPGPVFGPEQDRMLERQVLSASRISEDFPIVGACVTLV